MSFYYFLAEPRNADHTQRVWFLILNKNTMDVTKILMDEHKLILKCVNLLLEKSGGEEDIAIYPKFVDFIQNFADKYHHAKEEKILFREMEKEGVLSHCNPLPQMLHEHELGRGFVQGMISGLEQNDLEKIRENAASYGRLLQEHIHKEDNILYPMGEEGLSDAQKEVILNDYAEADKQHGGADFFKKYEDLLVELGYTEQ